MTGYEITFRGQPGNVVQQWLGFWQTISSKGHKTYNANIFIVKDPKGFVSNRIRYFDGGVSSVACFPSWHRTMHQKPTQLLDLHFRKFRRSIVRPPPHIEWTLAWEEILHAWIERAAHFVGVTWTLLIEFYLPPKERHLGEHLFQNAGGNPSRNPIANF